MAEHQGIPGFSINGESHDIPEGGSGKPLLDCCQENNMNVPLESPATGEVLWRAILVK